MGNNESLKGCVQRRQRSVRVNPHDQSGENPGNSMVNPDVLNPPKRNPLTQHERPSNVVYANPANIANP